MIIKLKGKIDFIDETGSLYLAVTNFFSFQIEYSKVVTLGEDIEGWFYLIMKEVDSRMDIKFFGFHNRSLISDFERLLAISGVGPKMAYSIIKSIPRDVLVKSIQEGDYKEIKKLPGIGDKLAKRIILELSRLYGKDDEVLQKMQNASMSKDQLDIIKTLVQMGFDKDKVTDGIAKLSGNNLSKQDLLKEVLKTITSNAD